MERDYQPTPKAMQENKVNTMEYITKQCLDEGDITYCNVQLETKDGIITDRIFVKAMKKKHGICNRQCDLYNPSKPLRNDITHFADKSMTISKGEIKGMGGCNGFCYKWGNSEDIVFEKVEFITEGQKIAETAYMQAVRQQKEEEAKKRVELFESRY